MQDFHRSALEPSQSMLAPHLAAPALTRAVHNEVMQRQTVIKGSDKVPLSENALLERVASQQDRHAFSRLFSELGPRVKAFMMKSGADPATAEEITQETFITVWRKSGQFDPKKASAITWIFTIARNARIDRLRKENRPSLDPDEPMLVPDDSPTPLQNLEQSTIVKRVKRSIEQLPEDQREVVHLSFIEGLSHQEIADAMGIPLGTVKSRLRLSFEKLRNSLGDLQ